MATKAVTPTDSASAIDFDVPAPGQDGYEEWRKSGKLPEAKEPEHREEPEVQEPESSEEEAESATAKPAVTRADSAPVKQQGKKKSGDERIRELANTNRELQDRIDALERRNSAEVKRETAAPQPAAEEKKAKPKLSDNDPKTGKPFASLESWSDAVDEWNDQRVNGILEERLGKERQTFQQTEYERRITQQTQQRTAPAVKKYADYIETVTNPRLLIPEGSATKLFLTHPNTKNEGEISYFLGKHPEVLEDFYTFDDKTGRFTNKVDPIEQVRYLAELDRQFTADAEPAPKAPVRTITQAPRPPHQVSGKSPAPDPLAKAVEEGDQAEFTRLENERLLAKRKASGGRR